ncbi:MAG: metallophosphoesterase [Roseovarius sp.]|nr:metallophosphoesterase [Roseovarius sp.]
MRSPFRHLFGRQKTAGTAEPDFDAALAPAAPFVAIGDIHGRADLLDKMISRMEQDYDDLSWVFLGDYVDRGPQSAQVLERLRRLQDARRAPTILLKGNHEKMMCDFLDDPLGRGGRWVQFGGIETMRSFGVKVPRGKPDDAALIDLSEALEVALPDGLLGWINDLPLIWRSGNLVCVHASMDPDVSPEEQNDHALIWGHRDFFRARREDGVWVVHGHTIVKTPTIAAGRIAVDTGAYQSGRLSAAHVVPGHCDFVTT